MGSQAVLDEVGRRSTMTPESSSFLHGYSHAQGLSGSGAFFYHRNYK